MLFTSPEFVVFLAAVLGLFYLLPKPARRYLLVCASLGFYMSWKTRFVFLLLGLITVDFFAALWIRSRQGGNRKVALVVSLAANIGMLGWFKYANFMRESWLSLVHPGTPVTPMDIILPLGISFHTFQSVSYVIDVYRGEQPAITSYIDYALFVSFFPQLVAGPIVRAKEFFSDYFNWRPPTGEEWQKGFALILTGYVKKLVFADQFALVADSYFYNPPSSPGFVPAWSGAIAFSLQIFFDFSGYTDIAIGVAALFGFHFPENFRRPYLSATITEFWRRWHMTLSSWLRDYVYIAMGGNRHGRIRTYLNLLGTMLIGGLWHGASWNFVIWGGYHGVLLAAERAIWKDRRPEAWVRLPFVAITFLLTCMGWVFFRAKTFSAAIFTVNEMFSPEAGASLMSPWQWRLAALSVGIALAEEYYRLLERLTLARPWIQTAAAVLCLFAIELFNASEATIPFLYFQF